MGRGIPAPRGHVSSVFGFALDGALKRKIGKSLKMPSGNYRSTSQVLSETLAPFLGFLLLFCFTLDHAVISQSSEGRKIEF